MNDLILYGAGGFGRETALMIDQINAEQKKWNVIGFVDDAKRKGDSIDGIEVLGGADFLHSCKSPVSVVMAIADPFTRQKLFSALQNPKLLFPTLVHPRARIGSKSNTIAEGCIITDGCIFTVGISIHAFSIVNLNCTIGHDVSIGKFSSLMPSSNISGNVKIGESVLIGTGVQILQGISIGDKARVGAGAVVTRDISGSVTVVGIPAKLIKR